MKTFHLLGVWLLPMLLVAPAQAAVWEIGNDGRIERLDTDKAQSLAQPAPPLRPDRAAARAARFRPHIDRAGLQYEISPALIDAIAYVESRYNPNAVSRAKATGIMQLMPRTARQLGVDRQDPAANIRGGTAYLRMLLNRFDGDIVRAVAAYNAGPGAVARANGVPRYSETVSYVGFVMDRLAAAAQ